MWLSIFGAVEQLLGEAQRAAGVAGQQHALGDGRVRAQMDGPVITAWTRLARHGQKGQEEQEVKQGPGGAADAVRDAVERTFQGAAGGAEAAQTRATELFDDVSAAMLRLRETVDERRVLETSSDLRDEVQGLAGRVALERSSVRKTAGRRGDGDSAARRATGARPRRASRDARARRRPPDGRASRAAQAAAGRHEAAAAKPAAQAAAAKPTPQGASARHAAARGQEARSGSSS